MFEVAICSEDLPLMMLRNRAQQKIYRRTGNAAASALIVHSSSFFIVIGYQRGVLVRTQRLAQTDKLCLLADAGENFLANRPNHLSIAVADQVRERADQRVIGCRESMALVAQSERPDGRVD